MCAVRKKIPLINETANLDVTGTVAIAGSGTAVITFPTATSTLATTAQLPTKITGATLDTLTDDTGFLTAKAIQDNTKVPHVAPGASGNIMQSDGTNWTSTAFPVITTLWTNGAPGSSFAAQTITLSSSNYSYLRIFYQRFPSADNRVLSMDIPSGKSADLFYADYSSGARAWNRTLTYSSTTSYSASDATINGSTTNTALVPLLIVGYK